MNSCSNIICIGKHYKVVWIPLVCVFLLLCLASCQNDKTEDLTDEKRQIFFGNAVYHWKNMFDLTDDELIFLKKHDVKRIYVRLFDVVESNDGRYRVEPSATVNFLGKIPDGVEIVPTIFITNEAVANIDTIVAEKYSNLIYKRIAAMAKANKLGKIREVQFDCDWSASTQMVYFSLCKKMRNVMKPDSIILSSTIRLHQLKKQAPPVDCGVLMLYNTANVKDFSTKNSILSYEDVKPYLKNSVTYALPLSFAYPTFGWDVLFRGHTFKQLCNIPDTLIYDTTCFIREGDDKDMYVAKKDIIQFRISCNDKVRRERPSISDVLKVKALVEKQIRQEHYPTILYHLGSEQLYRISESQIDSIYE